MRRPGTPGEKPVRQASIVFRSIISRAAGTIPEAMMSDTACDALSMLGNAASRV